MKPSIPPTPAERRLSMMLLGLMAGIAVTLLVLQSRYDPHQWRTAGAQPTQMSAPDGSVRPGEAGHRDFDTLGLHALTPPETYDAATLSDKINGKAELYLSAGFVSLHTRRLAPQGAAPGAFLECYVYDMGRRRNAFAVFSSQRRPGRETLDLAAEAYRAANGLFLVHGPYYLEIIAADSSAPLRSAALALAGAFVRQTPARDEPLIETTLFPEADRVPDSIALVAANAFGLEDFAWIFTAQYRTGPHEALAFLARRSTAAEAEKDRDAFASFFLEYGGEPVDPPAGLNAARIVTILDTTEIVISHGPFVLGVHEAGDRGLALELASKLLERVREATP